MVFARVIVARASVELSVLTQVEVRKVCRRRSS